MWVLQNLSYWLSLQKPPPFLWTCYNLHCLISWNSKHLGGRTKVTRGAYCQTCESGQLLLCRYKVIDVLWINCYFLWCFKIKVIKTVWNYDFSYMILCIYRYIYINKANKYGCCISTIQQWKMGTQKSVALILECSLHQSNWVSGIQGHPVLYKMTSASCKIELLWRKCFICHLNHQEELSSSFSA